MEVANWDSLASGTTQHLSDIYFYDTDIGYVVGFSGTILKTTNGGSVLDKSKLWNK